MNRAIDYVLAQSKLENKVMDCGATQKKKVRSGR